MKKLIILSTIVLAMLTSVACTKENKTEQITTTPETQESVGESIGEPINRAEYLLEVEGQTISIGVDSDKYDVEMTSSSAKVISKKNRDNYSFIYPVISSRYDAQMKKHEAIARDGVIEEISKGGTSSSTNVSTSEKASIDTLINSTNNNAGLSTSWEIVFYGYINPNDKDRYFHTLTNSDNNIAVFVESGCPLDATKEIFSDLWIETK